MKKFLALVWLVPIICLSGCRYIPEDIAECLVDPSKCPQGSTPSPVPSPQASATPTPSPTPSATATPSPTHSPSPSPSPQPTTQPTANPTPVCIPEPSEKPVSILWRGACPRYMEPLDFEGEGAVQSPAGYSLCAIKAGFGDGRTAWKLGMGLGRQGMVLFSMGGAQVQWHTNAGRQYCVDAYGRSFPDCDRIYPSEPLEFYPYGERGVYEVGGYPVPEYCSDIPQPTPIGPTPTPNPSCAAVEALEHFMAPGNKCHAWRFDAISHEIVCTVDSTLRPICDRDHMENWNSFCGGRDHDPDYESQSGAMDWFIQGAQDMGPHLQNSAQRVIRGSAGAEVYVKVCIPKDKRTPDGCLIARRGDGCGERTFSLPQWE